MMTGYISMTAMHKNSTLWAWSKTTYRQSTNKTRKAVVASEIVAVDLCRYDSNVDNDIHSYRSLFRLRI